MVRRRWPRWPPEVPSAERPRTPRPCIGEQRIHVELDDLGQVGVPGSGTTLTLYLPSPWPDAEPTIADRDSPLE